MGIEGIGARVARKEDRRFIFTAAAYAQRAADFLHAQQPASLAA